MKEIYIISFSVRGIKNIENWANLSFYKKTIDKNFNVQGYNVKGVYGANGSGKSAIISAVEILKLLIVDPSYLANHMAQKQLDSLINKHLETFEVRTDFLLCDQDILRLFRYEIKLTKDVSGKYIISEESLSEKNVKSHSDNYSQVFSVQNGFLHFENDDNPRNNIIIDRTKNLLNSASLSALYIEKFYRNSSIEKENVIPQVIFLYLFGCSLFVFKNSGDDHTAFYIRDFIMDKSDDPSKTIDMAFELSSMINDRPRYVLSAEKNYISINKYSEFEKEVNQLFRFLCVFKNDLKGISIKHTVDTDVYVCNLIMDYSDYSVDAEFESTGIKKLISLFAYLKNMVNGNIVFVDELDSNLHDVYLCALLEYLIEYGKGQLCFTTHNIGPMDILRRNKKSIDFLSADNRIVSWKKNGNYSPSKLYKEGMIEGSPFNVFPFDFIRVFGSEEDE